MRAGPLGVCPACDNVPQNNIPAGLRALAAAAPPPFRLSNDVFIEIDHVTFGYDERRTILNDLSLKFMRGKVTAVLGGSGCGKTTLLRLIGGVHAANRGRVVFDGEVIDLRNREQLYRLRRIPPRQMAES